MGKVKSSTHTLVSRDRARERSAGQEWDEQGAALTRWKEAERERVQQAENGTKEVLLTR